MKNFLIILKLFEVAIKNISGVSYCSASLVIPITNGLISVYSKMNEYPHEIMSVVSKINSGLKDRLSNVEYNDVLGITTFFDPRFKTFTFQIQEDTIIEDETTEEFSIWNSFDSNISHFLTKKNSSIACY